MKPLNLTLAKTLFKSQWTRQKLLSLKKKILAQKSPLTESETVKLKKEVVAGTEVVVPKSKDLGNPKADKVTKVQKGDPLSTNRTKYRPGTEFRKTKTTSIGTGASGAAKTLGGGSGDTNKAPNFAIKSTSPFADHGLRFKAKKDNIGDGSGRGYGNGLTTGSRTGTVEISKILTNMGSLTGETDGVIDTSKGAEGLSNKGTVVLAGIPSETIILGSIDPDLIRKILMEHLSQFRYCYQEELDTTSKPKNISGVFQLNFSIDNQGEVKKVNIGGGSSITSKVKSCVGGVLKDITFPVPKGGGIVEVKQPMNFYPKSY